MKSTFVIALLTVLLFACVEGSPKSGEADAGGLTLHERPAGPSADVSEEISGGNGPFIGGTAGLGAQGYVEQEYVAAGTATSYETNGALSDDGRWTFEACSVL